MREAGLGEGSGRGVARYQQIAAEIGDRIASGRLGVGERLPSARQITQEWGVAIATATKVLAALHQAGLTRPVPGVGTVVAEPVVGARSSAGATVPVAGGRASAGETVSVAGARTAAGVEGRAGLSGPGSRRDDRAGAGRRREVEPELSRERIVRAAVAVADAEGMQALSMRRVATELGVATMSLYRHVPGKEELLLHMADLVFGEHLAPVDPPPHWRDGLELVARHQWAMYRAHPWVVQAISFTRPMLAPNGMAYTEFAMRCLDGIGMDLPGRLLAVLTVLSGVHGVAVNLEGEREAEQESGVTSDEWMQAQEAEFQRIAADRFPLLTGVSEIPDFDVDLDALFEFNLSLVLDGLAAHVDRLAASGGQVAAGGQAADGGQEESGPAGAGRRDRERRVRERRVGGSSGRGQAGSA